MFDDTQNESLQDMPVQDTSVQDMSVHAEQEAQEVVQKDSEQSQAEIVEETPEQEKPETPAARAFRDMRTQKEMAERELELTKRYVREIEARSQQPQQPQPQPEPELSDSDLVEWKHVKKLQSELSSLRNQAADQVQESKLRTKYPDIDSVVTADNIERLRMSDPDSAQAVQEAKSLYAKGLLAYRLIKALDPAPGVDAYERDKQQAQLNAQKPRSLSSLHPQRGGTPLSRAASYAGDLTPELQKALLKEMNDAIKSR